MGGAALVAIHCAGGAGALLRLHSTYRHDFKIYSSHKGRVQVRMPIVWALAQHPQ
jgi:hypothetical protein